MKARPITFCLNLALQMQIIYIIFWNSLVDVRGTGLSVIDISNEETWKGILGIIKEFDLTLNDKARKFIS